MEGRNKRLVTMADKGKGGKGLCEKWPLELHLPSIIKHFSVNGDKYLKASLWDRDVCVKRLCHHSLRPKRNKFGGLQKNASSLESYSITDLAP